jgi:tetratricopeptide (TPR) repeat protein
VAPTSALPKVFISYAWETESHASWVKDFATRLRTTEALDVALDRWEAVPGDELPLFMERSIRESNFIILICTPEYKAKFDGRLGGVGYEANSIAGEILTGLAHRKIIPVHRSGSWSSAAPSVVQGNFFVDLRGSPFSESAYRALVDILHGRREAAPPITHCGVLFEGPGRVPARPVAQFSGRDAEFELLLSCLHASHETAACIVAFGIGGVGKTTLARQLVATKAATLFPEGSAWLDGTSLASELARVARRFGWPDAVDPTSAQATSFLMNQLHNRRVLLVIDNVSAEEDVARLPIPGGKCRTLITSRVWSLTQDLAADAPVATVRLDHWPTAICTQYLRDIVPRLAHEPEGDLNALGSFVQGLPLAVRLIARSLSHNVARSAKQHLERLRAEPLRALDQSASTRDRGVAATFLEAYRALSMPEQRTLRALAVCAQGTRTAVVAKVAGCDAVTVEDELASLVDKSLAEFREGAPGPWAMHDVVRLFVRAQPGLHENESAHLSWVCEHLQEHSDPLSHEKLHEGISEVVVAFEHLLANREHARASEVLLPVYQHLIRRGLFARAVEFGERLLANLESSESAVVALWLGNLGRCYETLGDLSKAINFIQRALTVEESLGNLEGQADQLGNLGLCYRILGDLPKAVDFTQRALAIEEQLGRLEGVADKLGNLGFAYRMLGDVARATELHERGLSIAEQLSSIEGQAKALGGLGLCHQELGDISKAIEMHSLSLALNEKLGRLEGQAKQLGNLGVCYRRLGDLLKAIELQERAIGISEKLGRLHGQAVAVGQLGFCYRQLGEVHRAMLLHERSLAMNETLGSLVGQAIQLGQLGFCHRALGDLPKAVSFYERALTVLHKTGLPDDHRSVKLIRKALAETLP